MPVHKVQYRVVPEWNGQVSYSAQAEFYLRHGVNTGSVDQQLPENEYWRNFTHGRVADV
jgi:hypothetical protein